MERQRPRVGREILVPSHKAPILPRGIIKISGNGSINPDAHPSTIDAKIAEINSPENVARLFMLGDYVHYITTLYGKGRAGLATPTARRGPYSAMAYTAQEDLPVGENGLVILSSLYDHPPEVQEAYWDIVLSTWRFYNRLPDRRFESNGLNYPKSVVAFTMNECSRISSSELTVPRTLSIPHGMVSMISEGDYTVPFDETYLDAVPRLVTEMEMLKRMNTVLDFEYFESFLKQLTMQKVSSSLEISVHPREIGMPFGYELHLSRVHGNLTATDLAQIMLIHHQLYAGIVHEAVSILDQSVYTAQPSYRLIGTMGQSEDGHDGGDYGIRMAVAPVLSSAGPQEVCGLLTYKDDRFPDIVPIDDVKTVNREAVKLIITA